MADLENKSQGDAPGPRSQPHRETAIHAVRHVLRGMIMGAADIIPGVSGGTMALILGIYERLVTAISRFDVTLLGHLKNRRWPAAAEHVDLAFLGAVFGGIALGIMSLASLMHYLLENHLQHTFAAFFGLIFASSFLVGRMVTRWTPGVVGMLVLALVFAYWLVGRLPAQPPQGNWYVFVCGAVALCAMILPGISGAFILLIMGKYEDITGMLRDMLRLNISLEALLTLGVFAAGAVVGLLGFSKFLHWLLARYHQLTIAALCGFMVGSLRRIWPYKAGTDDFAPNMWPDLADANAWLSVLIALLAGAAVLVLDRAGKRIETKLELPPNEAPDVE